jgi:hypothetical protein
MYQGSKPHPVIIEFQLRFFGSKIIAFIVLIFLFSTECVLQCSFIKFFLFHELPVWFETFLKHGYAMLCCREMMRKYANHQPMFALSSNKGSLFNRVLQIGSC